VWSIGFRDELGRVKEKKPGENRSCGKEELGSEGNEESCRVDNDEEDLEE